LPPGGLRFDRISCDKRPRGSQLSFERGTCNPYSAHYRLTFALSAILYPHVHRPSSRLACPLRRIYGLTLFHANNTNGIDLAYAPVTLLSASSKRLMEGPLTHLLVQAYKQLRPVDNYGALCGNSLVLVISSNLAPHPPCCWQNPTHPLAGLHGPNWVVTLSGPLSTPSLPKTHRSLGYRWLNSGSRSRLTR